MKNQHKYFRDLGIIFKNLLDFSFISPSEVKAIYLVENMTKKFFINSWPCYWILIEYYH